MFKVKEMREKRNLTQDELSRKSGVSKGIIVRLESGKEVVTQTSTLVKLSDALGCNISDIFLM